MENKVVCIKPCKSILTVNKVYEVKRENDVDTIVVVGDCGVRYVMPRAYFNKISVIKKVRYTKESCAYISNMVIGDTYEVVEETRDGFYIVINSKRMTTRVPKDCFEDEQVEDKVICIKAGGNGYITEGREYEVVSCREQEYGVINNIGEVYYYHKSLFKPKEDNPTITGEDSTITRDNGIWEDNIPKKVVCIDNGGNIYIKVGNEYEVVDDEGLQEGLILIKNDTGDVGMYSKKLFKSKEGKSRIMCVDKGTNKFLTLHRIYEVENEVNNLYYIYNDVNEVVSYSKDYFKVLEPIQSKNRNISLNLKFDTSELQSKLEKALYHLKELDKIMGEIGKGDVKVKVD